MLNKQSNPVVYMRGIKAKDLSYIKDFIYYGEVNIPQDDLQCFLALGEEFKLKGLVRESGVNSNELLESQKENNLHDNEPLALINECDEIKSEETLQELTEDITKIPHMKFNSDEYKDLDEQIKTMMKKNYLNRKDLANNLLLKCINGILPPKQRKYDCL